MIYVTPITHPTLPGEISLLARELRATSFYALTQREAIEQARALLAARGTHAANCLTRAIALAVAAETEADSQQLVESADPFSSM